MNKTPFELVKEDMNKTMEFYSQEMSRIGGMADATDLKSVELKARMGSTPLSGITYVVPYHSKTFDTKIWDELGFYPTEKQLSYLGDRIMRNDVNKNLPEPSTTSGCETSLYNENNAKEATQYKQAKENVLFFNTKMDKPYGTLRFVEGKIHLTQQKDKKVYHTVELNEDILRDILHHSNLLHDYSAMEVARREQNKAEQVKFMQSQVERLTEEINSIQKEINSVNS